MSDQTMKRWQHVDVGGKEDGNITLRYGISIKPAQRAGSGMSAKRLRDLVNEYAARIDKLSEEILSSSSTAQDQRKELERFRTELRQAQTALRREQAIVDALVKP